MKLPTENRPTYSYARHHSSACFSRAVSIASAIFSDCRFSHSGSWRDSQWGAVCVFFFPPMSPRPCSSGLPGASLSDLRRSSDVSHHVGRCAVSVGIPRRWSWSSSRSGTRGGRYPAHRPWSGNPTSSQTTAPCGCTSSPVSSLQPRRFRPRLHRHSRTLTSRSRILLCTAAWNDGFRGADVPNEPQHHCRARSMHPPGKLSLHSACSCCTCNALCARVSFLSFSFSFFFLSKVHKRRTMRAHRNHWNSYLVLERLAKVLKSFSFLE